MVALATLWGLIPNPPYYAPLAPLYEVENPLFAQIFGSVVFLYCYIMMKNQ